MSYKPDEQDWMDYLYDELEESKRDKLEHYLLANPDARKELERFRQVRTVMGSVKDKEVIAPPIVVNDNHQRFVWNAPYLKTIMSIAASLLLVMLAGWLTGTTVGLSGNEFRISFGTPKTETVLPAQPATITAMQVQQMIDASVNNSNMAMQANWKETQTKLDASIRNNLAANSVKVDKLVKEASNASQQQIREFVSGLQVENKQIVKDYFQLSSTEQKRYIENLLVDFAKYLQQQRTDDLKLVQNKLNNIEQNTDLFKQETEQILSSIITTVKSSSVPETNKGTTY